MRVFLLDFYFKLGFYLVLLLWKKFLIMRVFISFEGINQR
jgi:hypothetical protein